MIEYIKGIITKKTANKLILESNGIGYNIIVSSSNLNILDNSKKEIKLYISESSSMYSGTSTWYGFVSEEERELFEAIKTVSKIGAKGAIDILSRIGNNIDTFKACILKENSAELHTIFGFTKQKAEKLVLGLKNKMKNLNIQVKDEELEKISQNICNSNIHEKDAIEALKTLGYSAQLAKKVITDTLKTCEDTINISLEEIVKQALKKV